MRARAENTHETVVSSSSRRREQRNRVAFLFFCAQNAHTRPSLRLIHSLRCGVCLRVNRTHPCLQTGAQPPALSEYPQSRNTHSVHTRSSSMTATLSLASGVAEAILADAEAADAAGCLGWLVGASAGGETRVLGVVRREGGVAEGEDRGDRKREIGEGGVPVR